MGSDDGNPMQKFEDLLGRVLRVDKKKAEAVEEAIEPTAFSDRQTCGRVNKSHE